MNLTAKEIKALKEVLEYVSNDEAEDFSCNADHEDHIWLSIRVLYAKAFGEESLASLEAELGITK